MPGKFPTPPESDLAPAASPLGFEQKDRVMTPMRAFLLSFVAGLTVLFTGHGVISWALAAPVEVGTAVDRSA